GSSKITPPPDIPGFEPDPVDKNSVDADLQTVTPVMPIPDLDSDGGDPTSTEGAGLVFSPPPVQPIPEPDPADRDPIVSDSVDIAQDGSDPNIAFVTAPPLPS